MTGVILSVFKAPSEIMVDLSFHAGIVEKTVVEPKSITFKVGFLSALFPPI